MKRKRFKPVSRLAPALSAASLIAQPASAQVAKRPAPILAPNPAAKVVVTPPPEIVRITDFKIAPALPKEGDTVTATLTIKNESDRTLTNLKYTLAAGSTRDGVIASLAPQTSTSVSNTFIVSRGKLSMLGVVDPDNALKESKERAQNNRMTLEADVLPDSAADWNGWAFKAGAHIESMINSYRLHATMRGNINGPALTVTGISLDGANHSLLKAELMQRGLPSDVAAAIAKTFDRMFKDWATNYRAAVPWAFPAFAAFPGPQAPTMSGAPFPLSMGASTNTAALHPGTISAKLSAELSPSRLALQGAGVAVAALSQAMAGQMVVWIARQHAATQGSGPVPSFAPPYVPVGPVVNGSLSSSHKIFSQ